MKWPSWLWRGTQDGTLLIPNKLHCYGEIRMGSNPIFTIIFSSANRMLRDSSYFFGRRIYYAKMLVLKNDIFSSAL